MTTTTEHFRETPGNHILSQPRRIFEMALVVLGSLAGVPKRKKPFARRPALLRPPRLRLPASRRRLEKSPACKFHPTA